MTKKLIKYLLFRTKHENFDGKIKILYENLKGKTGAPVTRYVSRAHGRESKLTSYCSDGGRSSSHPQEQVIFNHNLPSSPISGFVNIILIL